MFTLKNIFNKTSISIGRQAERIAQAHLEKQGLVFIAKNYRCRRGEIDLIMKDQFTLVFIEVRYRSKPNYGSSAESVTSHKRQKLIIAAEHYLQAHSKEQRCICRFDVVALYQSPSSTATLHIDWIKHAFEAF